MKTKTKTAIVITACLIIIFYIARPDRINDCRNEAQGSSMKKELPVSGFRKNVTFILGEDREKDNPYYTEAENYYLYNKDDKTNDVVTGLKCLAEVSKYLKDNPPENQLPWGTINLVSHGNQWIGLSVQIEPGTGRTTAERLEAYMANDALKPLPDKIVDGRTIILIHGCGIGNNQCLIESIAKFFRSDSSAPVVRASRLFEYYTSLKKDGKVIATQRYFAKAWMTTYKMGYLPDTDEIISDFAEKYPDATVNWQYALSKTCPSWAGDLYHYTFEVPVKWVININKADSLPDFSSQKNRCNWAKKQKEIANQLEKLEIPAEKFNWWIRKVYVNNTDGIRSQALWVKGYATIVCIVMPLTDEKHNISNLPQPFCPDVYDNRYFYTFCHHFNKNYVEVNNAPLFKSAFPDNVFYNTSLSGDEDELAKEMLKR
ncbi:MAG: hypothetical protein JXB00_10815 [Bacteroidales bacterium]|nr:hypothetical protein [Bacteroidales bacterium]